MGGSCIVRKTMRHIADSLAIIKHVFLHAYDDIFSSGDEDSTFMVKLRCVIYFGGA